MRPFSQLNSTAHSQLRCYPQNYWLLSLVSLISFISNASHNYHFFNNIYIQRLVGVNRLWFKMSRPITFIVYKHIYKQTNNIFASLCLLILYSTICYIKLWQIALSLMLFRFIFKQWLLGRLFESSAVWICKFIWHFFWRPNFTFPVNQQLIWL